jgi:hypothetical protein
LKINVEVKFIVVVNSTQSKRHCSSWSVAIKNFKAKAKKFILEAENLSPAAIDDTCRLIARLCTPEGLVTVISLRYSEAVKLSSGATEETVLNAYFNRSERAVPAPEKKSKRRAS